MIDKLQAIANLALLLFAAIAHIMWIKALTDYDKKTDDGEEIDWP